MGPSQHLDWLADNIGWFLAIPVARLCDDVPSCPRWNVEAVINHLGYGVGLAYPYALVADPAGTPAEAFAGVPRPADLPTGPSALGEFERNMEACLDTFRHTDPAAPCFTYAGPGVAAFWFRRAAIETALHRVDVAEALSLSDSQLPLDRATDAIAESVEFALPLAARVCSAEVEAISVRVGSTSTAFKLGDGEIAAEVSGDPMSILSSLWGRSRQGIRIEGDETVADEWMSLVEAAFGGR